MVREGKEKIKRFKIFIDIDDPDYIDALVISLARQGYDVCYDSDSEAVYFYAFEENVVEIKN